MGFTNTFFIFTCFPLLLILNYLLKNKKSFTILLFLFNILFYMWGGVGSFILIFGESFFVWLSSITIKRSDKTKKLITVSSCIITLLPLLMFKYTNFVIENINVCFNMKIDFAIDFLPLGISFFTFQAISFLCDTYKGRITGKTSLFRVFFYLSFFLTIVSGPIVRYNNVMDSLDNRNVTLENTSKGIKRFIIGFSKKMLLSNNLAIIADYYFDAVANDGEISTYGLWIGAFAYTLQLFFDFSGYTDMAIGLGWCFGFSLPENFNYPYSATSVQDFWRRWHISLSQWFRDYIYIPLGGNRVSVPRHIFNMLVVWLCTGIWHGANWTFILWGLLYFGLLIFEKYGGKFAELLTKGKIGHIYTMFVVVLLWVVFRADSLTTVFNYIAGMFGVHTFGVIDEVTTLWCVPFILSCFVLSLPINKYARRFEVCEWYKVLSYIGYLTLTFLCVSALANSSYTPFIYGNF